MTASPIQKCVEIHTSRSDAKTIAVLARWELAVPSLPLVPQVIHYSHPPRTISSESNATFGLVDGNQVNVCEGGRFAVYASQGG